MAIQTLISALPLCLCRARCQNNNKITLSHMSVAASAKAGVYTRIILPQISGEKKVLNTGQICGVLTIRFCGQKCGQILFLANNPNNPNNSNLPKKTKKESKQIL